MHHRDSREIRKNNENFKQSHKLFRLSVYVRLVSWIGADSDDSADSTISSADCNGESNEKFQTNPNHNLNPNPNKRIIIEKWNAIPNPNPIRLVQFYECNVLSIASFAL